MRKLSNPILFKKTHTHTHTHIHTHTHCHFKIACHVSFTNWKNHLVQLQTVLYLWIRMYCFCLTLLCKLSFHCILQTINCRQQISRDVSREGQVERKTDGDGVPNQSQPLIYSHPFLLFLSFFLHWRLNRNTFFASVATIMTDSFSQLLFKSFFQSFSLLSSPIFR